MSEQRPWYAASVPADVQRVLTQFWVSPAGVALLLSKADEYRAQLRVIEERRLLIGGH